MKSVISESLLSRLSALVDSNLGLHFPPSRWSDLERMLRSASDELGSSDPEPLIDRLLSSTGTNELMEQVVCHLTIGESYFWREPQVFDALKERIVPELIRSRGSGRRRLRIWSAGCSTGEEPYSIAIALRRALPGIDDRDVTILATDINPRMLRAAMAGQYGEWSFRNSPSWLRDRFFRATEGKSGKREIIPEIRRMVSFAKLNLATDDFPSPMNDTDAMDIIFCRNVLMYLSPDHAIRVVQKLHRALVDGGWLMTGASELSQLLFSSFAAVQFPEAIVYRKSLEALCAHDLPVEKPPEPPATKAEAHATRETPGQEDPPAVAPLVRRLAGLGRLSEALTMCDEAIARDRLDPELHYLQATILQESDRIDEAFASIKRTLYLDPGLILAHFTMGNLALRRGDARTAERSFKTALDLLVDSRDEEILPESEGLTAGRLRQIIGTTMNLKMEAET
jgi:chemotaxis protein methyltransferase CheR